MNAYHTNLDTTSTDPLNQLHLEAEVKYALLQDFEYIIDSEGRLFAISEDDSKITIIEISDKDNDDDEDINLQDEECEDCNEELDRLTTSELIDTIIRNSLLAADPITLEQAQTMVVLANLKALLDAE